MAIGPNRYEQWTARSAACEHPLVLDEATVPLALALYYLEEIAEGQINHSDAVNELLETAEAERRGEHTDVSLDLVDVEGTIVDGGDFVFECPYCFTDHNIPLDDHITLA